MLNNNFHKNGIRKFQFCSWRFHSWKILSITNTVLQDIFASISSSRWFLSKWKKRCTWIGEKKNNKEKYALTRKYDAPKVQSLWFAKIRCNRKYHVLQYLTHQMPICTKLHSYSRYVNLNVFWFLTKYFPHNTFL